MKAAYKEGNGGDSFIAVKLNTLEGLSDEGKKLVLRGLKELSSNIYSFEKIKDDKERFVYDEQGRLQKTLGIDIYFVNEKTGWFLTKNLNNWNGELYFTSNSGSEWEKINQIKCVRPFPMEICFTSSHVGWIPLDVGAGPVPGGLLFTRDGGKNFNLINNENSLTSIREINFISEQHGWAVCNEPNTGDYLVHTSDGGKTWVRIFSGCGQSEQQSSKSGFTR